MSKVVIVTGGGRGIGAATAKLLGAKGYAVCVNYLANSERADEVAGCIVREQMLAVKMTLSACLMQLKSALAR